MTYPYLKTKFKSTVPPGAGANLRSRRRRRRRCSCVHFNCMKCSKFTLPRRRRNLNKTLQLTKFSPVLFGQYRPRSAWPDSTTRRPRRQRSRPPSWCSGRPRTLPPEICLLVGACVVAAARDHSSQPERPPPRTVRPTPSH